MPSRRVGRSRALPPLDVEALWQIKRMGNPTLSPDGRQACVPVTSFVMDTDQSKTELWLFPTGLGESTAGKRAGGAAEAITTGRGRRLTVGDKDSDPRWSPDGKWIAFTAKRKDDSEPQVYRIAPDGGEAERVTKVATGAASPKWFPDSRRIAFVSWVWPDLATDAAQGRRLKERRDSKVKAHTTERAATRYWDHWIADGKEPHVFACDVRTGHSEDLLAGLKLALPPWDPSADDYDIAPDGTVLAITADLGAEPDFMNQRDIVTVDLATRRKQVLTATSGTDDVAPSYSPDGKWLVYTSHDTDRAFNDQGHLTLHQRRGGATRALAPKFDRAAMHVQWTPDSSGLLFLAEDRGRVGLYRLPLAAPAPELLVPGGAISGFARSRGGDVLAYTRAAATHPPQVFASRGNGTAERGIESMNRALLARHALGEVREFTVKGWHGEPVQVWVVYPPGFGESAGSGKKWPLLHSIHGGPHAAHQDTWHFRWNTQVFAGRGYVVACVNYHGSSGFGQQFLETITSRYGEKEFADTEAATDFMLKQGYIDRTRLVAAGGSYGGFMVAFMNGHTDRYKAFVCHAGCYDWVSMMATDAYKFFSKELGAFHWDNPAQVMRQSPHHYVKSAKTPTLVIHGEQDFRVPATQGLQYYNSLKAKDVPARLVWFPDENHWILKPQNSRHWYGEFFAWVERYAKGGAARAAAK
jgi:dipeptidyl aminopeptidase/acylaminoacyl peptidase